MTDTVLVVAAHPDDEVLGCGGTIARHALDGDDVFILILAEGATSRDGNTASTFSAEVTALQTAATKAAEILGVAPPRFLGLPDNRLDSLDLLDVVKAVEAVISEISPTIVYTHYVGDLNIDHQIAFRAVITACRPQPDTGISGIYTF